MSINSDEVNFLIYRYLQESGLAHSAFTFAHESLVARSVVADSEVPPGALLSFLQKGLQYVEIETHLQEDGTERACDEPFYLLSPHVCRLRPAKSTEVEGIVAHTATNLQTNFTAADIRGLLGHLSEVFSLAWSPSGSALVSGGSDGTARVWQVSERSTSGGEVPCLVLRPAQGGAAAAGSSGAVDLKPRKDKSDVTRVEWHPQGQLLATASIDGRARLWLCQGGGGGGEAGGKLVHTLSMHTGQIFDMAFSPSGTLLATAGGTFCSFLYLQPCTLLTLFAFLALQWIRAWSCGIAAQVRPALNTPSTPHLCWQ